MTAVSRPEISVLGTKRKGSPFMMTVADDHMLLSSSSSSEGIQKESHACQQGLLRGGPLGSSNFKQSVRLGHPTYPPTHTQTANDGIPGHRGLDVQPVG